MKVYEEVVIPERKITDLARKDCDLCGQEGKYGQWTSGYWDVAETEMWTKVSFSKEATEYNVDDYNRYLYEYDIDICPKCFIDKLIPWVESYGKRKIEPIKLDL